MNKYAHLAKEAKQKAYKNKHCENKKPFNSFDDAIRETGTHAYQCQFCNKWHRTQSIHKLELYLKRRNVKNRNKTNSITSATSGNITSGDGITNQGNPSISNSANING